MLVDLYIKALQVNEAAADAVWDAWHEQQIDDELAAWLWRLVAATDSGFVRVIAPARPFVIGRKNSLFSDTVAGANANPYSLIETAKAYGIEPYGYLRLVFTDLPQATSVDEIETLLPVPSEGEQSVHASWSRTREKKSAVNATDTAFLRQTT